MSEVSTGKQGLPDILPPVAALQKEIEKFSPLKPIQSKECTEKLLTTSHQFSPSSHPPVNSTEYIYKGLEDIEEVKNPSAASADLLCKGRKQKLV